jgi:hypothetical protein
MVNVLARTLRATEPANRSTPATSALRTRATMRPPSQRATTSAPRLNEAPITPATRRMQASPAGRP